MTDSNSGLTQHALTQHGISPIWSSLVKTALLGTARQSFPTCSLSAQNSPETQSPMVQALLSKVDWNNPSGGVLDAAGAIALYKNVGALPQAISFAQAHPILNASPIDSRPLCSAQTAKYLRHGLQHDRDVCLEIMAMLIDQQQRLPEEYLPALLDFGLQHPTAQDAICHLTGKKGRWLAKQHSNWTYAQWDWSIMPPDTEEGDSFDANDDRVALPTEIAPMWLTGTPTQRSEVLSRWRAIAPNAARSLLESVWSQESAKHRTLLLPVLNQGLSLADEPFLERTLSDRSASVRSIAAHLLARLPQSQWCQRMTEWGRSLLTFGPQNTLPCPSSDESSPAAVSHSCPPLSLQITLPAISANPLPTPQDKSGPYQAISGQTSSGQPSSGQSSSVQSRSAQFTTKQTVPNQYASPNVLPLPVPLPQPMGPTASAPPPQAADKTTDPTHRLQIEGFIQIIASMPLEHWQTVAAPELLIATVQNHDNQAMIMRGWELATMRQKHALWAEALLRHHLTQWGMAGGISVNGNVSKDLAAASAPDAKWLSNLMNILSPSRRERLLLEMTPAATRQQISLLSELSASAEYSSPYGIEVGVGAADGEPLALWLSLAVASANLSETSALSPTNDWSKTSNPHHHSMPWQGWSPEFSRAVLSQLYRDISHHQPAFIRQVRTLAKAIAMRLDPSLSETSILGALADRTIPGPTSLERSWDQAIEIIRSTLTLRYELQNTFLQDIQENSG